MAGSHSGNMPPLFTFGDEASPSTSQEFFEGASCTSAYCATFSHDAWRYQWNTEQRPITDGTYNVDGENEDLCTLDCTGVTDNGSTSYLHQAFSSSIDHATHSGSRIGTKQTSAIIEGGARIAETTGVRRWNTHYQPADGTSAVYGHTHNTETGSACFKLPVCSSSSGSVNSTVASTSYAQMQEPSDMFGNGTWNGTGVDARKRKELSAACSNVSSSRDALHGHTNEDSGDTDQICKSCDLTSVNNSMFIKHCRKSTDGNHKCETCGKWFHLAYPLAAHYRTHANHIPYQCHICNKSFQSSGHLDDHKRTHAGEKSYTCETGGKPFTQVSHLRAHQKIHATEKPHVCHKCTKPFKCKRYLKYHLKWHCGGGGLVCGTCRLSFVDSSDLVCHRQTFHGYKMPHEGIHCGFRFAKKEALDEHMCRNHMCYFCGASFGDTVQLITHLWTHTGGQS